jgi:hypothetical protein
MAHAFRYLIAVCVVGIFAASASAQTNLPVVRFSVFAAKPPSEISYIPRPGAAPQKIVFQSTARSPRYEYRGSMPLRFGDTTVGATVAEAVIPSEMREALLLFLPVENAEAAPDAKAGAAPKGLRYKIAVLDDSAAARGPGGLAIINLSGRALAGTVGDKEVDLKSGYNAPLPVGAATRVALGTTEKGRFSPAYSSTVQLRRGERALLILLPPFYKGSMEVQSRLLIDDPAAATRTPAPVRK